MRLTRVPVCNACWNQLPQQSGALCAVCGEALGLQGFYGAASEADGRWCRMCQLAEPPFTQAVAHGLYQGKLRMLLHLLKYDGMEPVADKLGLLLAKQISSFKDCPSKLLVIPVPLYRGKRQQRGFNQSELLTRAAVKALRRLHPEKEFTVAAGLLARRRATESQAGLTPHQRRANMRGAFFAPSPERLKGADVLLIDDIYTTGATARACAQALLRAGAHSVRVATVARAQRQEMLQPPAMPAAEVPMHEDVAFWDAGLIPAARSV